jgi:hypothetical protein
MAAKPGEAGPVENMKDEMYYYRSSTCVTYWSLVMLNNALSPEIGGNFIESMNAPEYYERRLRYRLGMPVMNWELKKEKFFDFHPQSYAIFQKTMDNGERNRRLIKRLRKIQNQEPPETDEQKIEREKEIKERIAWDWAFVDDECLKAFSPGEPIKFIEKDGKSLPQEERDINAFMFYPKVRQTRTAFYQVEQALHFQLKQLFNRDTAARERALYNGFSIFDRVKRLCAVNQDCQEKMEGWDKHLAIIEREFRTHVVFELLTYFYHKDKRPPVTG